MDTQGWSPIDTAALVYIGLTLIGLLIVFLILRGIVRKLMELWSKGSLFGSDQKTRLIGLGLVALLFPSIFYGVGNAIISFIGNFFVDVPKDLVNNWQTAQSICQGYQSDFGFCASQLGYGFVQAWTSAFADALNRFGPGYIPYGRLVLMLALWAGISALLGSAIAKEDRDGTTRMSRLQAWLDGLGDATRQNMMFFLVLLVAGYLSIAAITAIPGLEESATPSENVSEAQLERQLDDASKQTFERIPAQISFSDPAATPTASGATPSPEGEGPVPVAANLNEEYIKLQRGFWQSAYSEFLESVQKQAESSKTDALSQYQASVIARKGTKETVQHFLDIGAWYRGELSDLELQLADCRRLTTELDRQQNVPSTDENPSAFTFQAQQLQQLQRRQREACESRKYFEQVPPRHELGSNLGPFSYVASWLLRTESLALAQIVGLLGFGLLGSAVSSLVRSKQKHSPKQPLVNELATVIIRGATAAVVVFLAVKGGLAIFTSGESNANSYVLLLTCLVAAVFSEDVWAEAQTRFNKGLKGEGTPPPPGAPPAPESNPPPAPEAITTEPAAPTDEGNDPPEAVG